MEFRVSPEVAALGIPVTAFAVTGMTNTRYPAGWPEHWSSALSGVHRWALTNDLVTDPTLAGYRDLHAAIGVPGRKAVAAPEALIMALLKGKGIRPISPVVDAYNLVSAQTRLAIGCHDMSKIVGSVELRITDGMEKFSPIGVAGPAAVRAGEYAYVDDFDRVICRLEVRQAAETLVTASTTDYLFIVQGNPRVTVGRDRQVALRLADELTENYGGGIDVVFP
jgi:DNA/RNA-binding domain of Phe-tRNA-synthetase-like protein